MIYVRVIWDSFFINATILKYVPAQSYPKDMILSWIYTGKKREMIEKGAKTKLFIREKAIIWKAPLK